MGGCLLVKDVSWFEAVCCNVMCLQRHRMKNISKDVREGKVTMVFIAPFQKW